MEGWGPLRKRTGSSWVITCGDDEGGRGGRDGQLRQHEEHDGRDNQHNSVEVLVADAQSNHNTIG